MVYIIILLLLLIFVLSFSNYKMLNKIKKYEDITNQSNEKFEQIKKYVSISLEKLHDIDRKQIFEGDDDVGWFFKSLKFIITDLNNSIAIIFGEKEYEEEEKKE